jgi:uncharacterized protein (TIGR02270 family)
MANQGLPHLPAERAEDLILWDIVEQHLDEAEFQCEAFERALESCVYTLDSLAKGPERWLLAHLDGLVVNGPPVVERLLLPLVTEPDPAEPYKTMAATLALIQAGHWDRMKPALFHEDAGVRRAAVRAAGLAAAPELDRWVLGALGSARVPAEVAGLLDYVAERRLPAPGPLFAWLQDADPAVAAAAARATAWSDFRAHMPALESLLTRPEKAVREAARIPALFGGSAAAWAECEGGALASAPSAPAACLYAALGGATEHANLVGRLADAAVRPTVLLALALSGNAGMVPELIRALEDEAPAIRKLALQAIAAITGLSLEDDAFLRPPPVPPASGSLPPPEEDPEAQAALPPLEEDALDVPPAPLPEEALDEPNAAAIARWWEQNQGRFSRDRRLLSGQPFSPASIAQFLVTARMRLRPIVALSVAVRTGGEVWPDLRALSSVQKRDFPPAGALASHRLRGRTTSW